MSNMDLWGAISHLQNSKADHSNITDTVAMIDDLTADVEAFKGKMDSFYLMWAGATVFLMQCGFGMLEAGSISERNTRNILLKNMLDACIGAIVWFSIGFGFAYDGDDSPNGFIGAGASNFALSGVDDTADDYTGQGSEWIGWYFQYAFAAATATIVSGAVAERAQLGAYLIYTTIITGFIYPVVVHWVWDGAGWISAFNTATDDTKAFNGGCMDFAGSGVVHMTGGVAALMGALIIKPRGHHLPPDKKIVDANGKPMKVDGQAYNFRFTSDGKPVDMPGHSSTLAALGTFILWFGWYGFNPGSTLAISPDGYSTAMARVAVTTTLSPAAACIVVLLLKAISSRGSTGMIVWDLGAACNGVLGGLVSITAGCSVVEPGFAILIGFIGGFIYYFASYVALNKCKVDDPLDAFAVHGACGFWGVLAVGLFASKDYTYSQSADDDGQADYGLFRGGNGTMFVAQLVALILEVFWVASTSSILFFLLDKCGLLRVNADVEEIGMDLSKHGGTAYVNTKEAENTEGGPKTGTV